MDPKWGLLEPIFSEKVRNRKSVFGLRRRVRIAYEPIPWNAHCDPKLKKKTNTFKKHLFWHKISENVWKLPPKCVQKSDSISGVAPVGAPLAPHAVFWHEKCMQSAPKVTPRWQNWLQSKIVPGTKNYLKNYPKGAKMTLKVPLKVNSLQWPGGLREALTIRRPLALSKRGTACQISSPR